jgi:hypothetical protein
MPMVRVVKTLIDLTLTFTIVQSEKQFYLDQAKILKENFNSKYPDYVYRRRPNNTRKKNRRGDIGGLRQLDNPQLDDIGGHELGESSHTDDEVLDPSSHYSRVPHDVPHAYDNHVRYGSAPSRYSISSDGFRPTSTHDARVQYQQPSDRLPQDIAGGRLGQPNHNSYSYPYQAPASTGLYESIGSAEGWQQHKVDRGCPWPPTSGNPDRIIPLGNSKLEYPPSSSPSSWQSPGPQNPASNGAPGSNSYHFQSLATSFTPSQNAIPGYSSSPSPVGTSHYEASSHGSREYGSRYAPSPSISPSSYPGSSDIPYPPRQTSLSRNVTSVPGISSFNHPGMQPTETHSSHGYWSRE